MFEITNIRRTYADFILASRSVDCSTISREDFMEMLRADITEAMDAYNEISIPHQIEIMTKRNTERIEKNRQRDMDRAAEYAAKKWKTEKRRNQHLQDVKNQLDAEIANYKPRVRTITFFDFDGNCETSLGISGYCIIDPEKMTDEKLINCFEYLKEYTTYFNKATGWIVGYEGDSSTYESCFRPYIKLTFNEEITNEIKENKEALARSVEAFYSGMSYID